MKLIRFEFEGRKHSGVVVDGAIAPVAEINARRGTFVPDDLLAIIQTGDLEPLRDLRGCETIPATEVRPVLPYDVPPKIWCIGLNYKSHAEDIQATQPEEPGSFMKPASCMFEPGGRIVLPPPEVSNEVDAEGELGVVIGQDVPVRAGWRCARRDFRLHDDAGSDGAGCAAAESAISDAREEHRHVLQFRSGDCDGGRGGGRRCVRSGDRAQRRHLLARLRAEYAASSV